MSRKTFTAGSVLTASDVNTYLAHEGGAWTTWAPAVTQSAALTATVNEATVAKDGRRATGTATVTITGGAAVAANNIYVTLPEAAKTYPADSPIGAGYLHDTTSGKRIPFQLVWRSATTANLLGFPGTAGLFHLGLGSSGFSGALVAGDNIRFTFSYETAA